MCAGVAQSFRRRRDFFSFFPFSRSLDRSQQPSPHGGDGLKQENVDLKAGERGPQAGEHAVSKQDSGPQQHAARDADGSGSLDAAEPLDTKKTKGGTRIDSAVHAPQVRGLRQGRRRDGRVLHVRSSRACRCSRRPCSSRSSASAQLGLHEGSAPPASRSTASRRAWATRRRPRPPLVETLVIEDGHAVAEHFRALGPHGGPRVCGEAACSV